MHVQANQKTQWNEIPTTFWLSKIGGVVSINLDCGSEADAKDAFDSIMSGHVRATIMARSNGNQMSRFFGRNERGAARQACSRLAAQS